MVELSDRSKQEGGISRRARTTLAAVRELADRATTLLAAPAVLRDSARRQVEVLTAGQVTDRLRATPITALRELVGRGVRLGALQQAGVATVADVLGAPEHRLQQVPGVGAQTVLEVRRAARTVAVQVQRDVRFRIDPDRRDPAQTHLIASLAATRAADAASTALREPLEAFLGRTGPLVAEADRAASRLSMFFSRRRRKDPALEALSRLEAILEEPGIRGLDNAVAAQEQAVDPASYDPGALWDEYLQNAAGINAVLSTVGAAPHDDDAARGFVPEELRQQVTAVPLDLSHLMR